MAVVEGYAEHVMDAVGEDVLPSLHTLRAALDRRRHAKSTPLRLLEKLLGLEMKLRQYEVGKRFCDEVVQEGGLEALNRVWSAPDALPSLSELQDPRTWRDRTQVRIVTN
jgi:putative hydrolase